MTDEVFIREPGVEGCEHLDVCEHACRMWCRSYKPRVDRDALLKLADEMEIDGAGALDDDDWCKPLLVEYAQRIRKALGVDDGD